MADPPMVRTHRMEDGCCQVDFYTWCEDSDRMDPGIYRESNAGTRPHCYFHRNIVRTANDRYNEHGRDNAYEQVLSFAPIQTHFLYDDDLADLVDIQPLDAPCCR